MRRWLEDQLEPISRTHRLVIVALDPEKVLNPLDLHRFGEVIQVADWYGLRRAYERQRRGRTPDLRRLVILLRADEFADSSDLPYDIERNSCVVRIRVPVPVEYRRLVLELTDHLSDRAVQALGDQSGDPTERLVAHLWGVQLPSPGEDEVREVDATIRLRTDPTVPSRLWDLVKPRLRHPLANALAKEPPDLGVIQQAWADWLDRGAASSWDGVLRRLGVRLAPLFHTGSLQAARLRAADLPLWVRLGVVESAPLDRAEELVTQRPLPWPPLDVGGWMRVAEWWGELRAALAEGGEEIDVLRPEAWNMWEELHTAFLPYLQGNLGSIMLQASPMPLSVNKIAPFLARRLRSGAARRVLLVVIDGLAFTQLSMLRRMSNLKIVNAGASFAMIPTLTPVSRQAIFAGELPLTFADTLKTTAAEPDRWRHFWEEQEIPEKSVRYTRIRGVSADKLFENEAARVVGVVITAVDEMLHGSHLLGDAQVASALRVWAGRGFLRGIVEQAEAQRFEVWITADHGNLESLPLGRVMEGLTVEMAGVRVRWYPNSALRDGRRAEGIVWDPPGLPEGECYPLFAPGRGGYFYGELRVTHGGLSLDEVIVPLVQVTV